MQGCFLFMQQQTDFIFAHNNSISLYLKISFFVQSYVPGHLGCIQVSAFVTNAAMIRGTLLSFLKNSIRPLR